ncbi:MAG: DUF3562 domain-containing protein [Usitatibacter sp.]
MPRQVGIGGPTAQDMIAELAHATERPTEEVRAIYERELDWLSQRAKVRIYLTILAKRRTREALRR